MGLTNGAPAEQGHICRRKRPQLSARWLPLLTGVRPSHTPCPTALTGCPARRLVPPVPAPPHPPPPPRSKPQGHQSAAPSRKPRAASA